MSAETWLLALLLSSYAPYPYSWQDGSDAAWRRIRHVLAVRHWSW